MHIQATPWLSLSNPQFHGSSFSICKCHGFPLFFFPFLSLPPSNNKPIPLHRCCSALLETSPGPEEEVLLAPRNLGFLRWCLGDWVTADSIIVMTSSCWVWQTILRSRQHFWYWDEVPCGCSVDWANKCIYRKLVQHTSPRFHAAFGGEAVWDKPLLNTGTSLCYISLFFGC